MGGDDKPNRKIRRWLILAILLVAFVALVMIVFSLLPGGWLGFSQRSPGFTVNEFSFDVGRNRVFAHADDSVAAVGTLGAQVFNTSGRETLRDSFRMSHPAIVEAGHSFLAFDIGGSTVRVFSTTQILSSIETEGTIVSASINKNGWFCIVTQEMSGLRGAVTVYNSLRVDVYKVNLGSYVLSAHLSHDNKSLAILTLTDSGSRVTFYHGLEIDKNDPDYRFDLPGGLIIDIRFLPNGDILAVSTDSLFLIESSGNSRTLYEFTDKRLGGYSYNDGFVALHIYNYGIGYSGQLVTVGYDGTVLGVLDLDKEIVSISSSNSSLIVLRSDGLIFFDKNLEEYPVDIDHISTAAANRILALSDDAALVTSDHSAVVIRREEGH